MAEIVWTAEAAGCLEEIYQYIASDSVASAHGVVRGIYNKVQLLASNPRLGQVYEGIKDREVREILYGHYRIAYAVRTEDRIEVLDIFHTALDIERHLK